MNVFNLVFKIEYKNNKEKIENKMIIQIKNDIIFILINIKN